MVNTIVREPGAQGPSGLVWRGAYSADFRYEPSDGMRFQGSAYRCLRPNVNIPPTGADDDPYWSLMVQGSESAGGISLSQTLWFSGLGA